MFYPGPLHSASAGIGAGQRYPCMEHPLKIPLVELRPLLDHVYCI